MIRGAGFQTDVIETGYMRAGSQVMRNMKASSLPDLARMADKLNFTADGSQVC